RAAHQRLGGIEDRELPDEFLGLPLRVLLRQQRAATAQRARHHRDEFDHRLMWNADAVFAKTAAEKFGRDGLLPREASIEPREENVRVSERGHAGTHPPDASRDRRRAQRSRAAAAAVSAGWWRRRTASAGPPGSGPAPAFRVARRGSRYRPVATRCRRRA